MESLSPGSALMFTDDIPCTTDAFGTVRRLPSKLVTGTFLVIKETSNTKLIPYTNSNKYN